jgi:hypothetical protein
MGKTNCSSFLDIADIRLPTGQIREFSTFTVSVSTALRLKPSFACGNGANNVVYAHFWAYSA